MKKKKLGDVTSINIKALQSGVSSDGGKTHALNVIPTEAIAGFDIRIAPGMDIAAMGRMLDAWCAAEGVSWEFASWTKPMHAHYTTSLDADNVWWQLFQKACARMGEKLETEVFPAATDSRYLRKAGMQAIGFSPMKNTEILLHEHDEYLHKDTFLRGIEVYETIFRDMFAH
jgi:aminoacylase